MMVTKTNNQLDQLVSMLDKLETAIRALASRGDTLLAQIDEIERLGWCDAKPYYRDGKYFYLIYPMQDGERKREYIGVDPEKIQAALDKIQRKHRYDLLEAQLAEIEQARFAVLQNLTAAFQSAYSVTW